MEAPICFTQYFVNKQNVRSFGNILKSNVTKNKDIEPFLQHILGKSLMGELSPEIIQILTILRNNVHNKSRENFKNDFSSIPEEKLISVNKSLIFTCCWTALNEIIPKNFFGTTNNTKLLKKFIKSVVFSMKRQYMPLKHFIQKWDFTVRPWNFFTVDISTKILYNILIWMVKFILSPMICLNFYVTTCKLDSDENKLHFFWKNQWQSFYDKKISDMIFSKVLKRFDPYCIGKKVKKNYSLRERSKLKFLHRDIPKLHLILKPNRDCRPIVRYKSDQQSKTEKYKIKEKLHFLKLLTCKSQNKIESQYNKLYQNWSDLKKPPLYFIKTDLSNAFGSINKEKLMKFLCEKHLNFQKTEKNSYFKKKAAQQYKEIVAELRKPLLVRAGNTVFEWMEGLVQGYKYSPALSELYYTCLDEIYFAEHLTKLTSQIKLFTRVVDDYLYVTDSLEDALLFLQALFNFRNVNYEKTVVNFKHETIKSSNIITFLGYSYNTSTLEVSRAHNVFVGQMCYKMAFTSALANLNKFLENRIGQSGIQINNHLFNFIHNSEELIWQHIFTTFCLSANKFCTILAILCGEEEMKHYILLYKKRVAVKLSNSIIGTLVKTKPADFQFMYCINHFRYLAFKALYLCAKDTPKCSRLVPLINSEIAKSNCLYGKWRDHACRIETSGEIRQAAIKEICKRQELRIIVKSFGTLPDGFQCYNHKKLM
ncbi:telomerase reverse transcriptase-like [Hyposmocoma kahamanoa]|uniref:telomerase reverse transcriptase-like n=1 Tax=Hyposmocoma kahamanoa TaxID=1477025 RepID=UPI000E6D978A|nr:telomerase reverse transcriptase-like [Hyposmocoma kahamanoa]